MTTVTSTTAVVTTTTASDSSSGQWTINMIKTHGILMVFAWMVFASCGVLMPRYCKSAWPNVNLGGKKIDLWFQIHRATMLTTFILTLTSFIIIFVEAAGVYMTDMSPPASAHPAIGITVMILVMINAIMAIFRCEKDNKNRIIFNIVHFIVGLLAHLLAIVNIFIGMYVPQLDLPTWTIYVMSAFICFQALVEIILAFHMHRHKILKRNAVATESSAQKEQTEVTAAAERDWDSTFKSVMLVIDVVGVLGFAIAIAVQIGIAIGNPDS